MEDAYTYRDFKLGEKEQREILELDVLYRINATKNGQHKNLLLGMNELYDKHLDSAFFEDLLSLDESGQFSITSKGEKRLAEYGALYQKFKDYAIFKCVYLEEEEPEENEPDERFGDFEEEANPENGSEDLRFGIFENYGKRENKSVPLHLIAHLSIMDNRDLDDYHSEKDWIWDLVTGDYYEALKEIIDTQVSMEEIVPDDMEADEICDIIVEAGFKELKRCFEAEEEDDDYYSPSMVQQETDDFWVEEVIVDTHVYDPGYYDPYYDPYWDGLALSALAVGVFVLI